MLTSVRPSNLIVLTALPFIVYLFASSSDYQRSLRAILGVENGSGVVVPGFLALAAAFACGLAAVHFTRPARYRPRWAAAAAGSSVVVIVLTLVSGRAHPFIASVVANGVDPFTSDLILRGVTPRQLTETADATVRQATTWLSLAYLGSATLGLGLVFAFRGRSGSAGRWLLGLVNGAGLVFLLFFAHIAFASGVATTIRAALSAYVLAAMLGLVWVGLLQLRRTVWTSPAFVLSSLVLAGVSAWFLLQPRDGYVLTGTPGGTIGIVAGTPSDLVTAVRFGDYEGAPQTEASVRTFLTPADAVAAVTKGDGVTAALLPAATAPADWPVIWRTEALNDRDRAAGVTFAVLAIALGLLTLGGHLHRRHPLAVASEFVIDTIRGIPMLVIVLYVGLPLSGALKDATNGILDPPNLMRGIVAIGLAYSAYLAEIFRAGINAVPTGQTEAALSLGLNRWRTARLVVLPQAFRIIIPPLGNELIAILKDTSLLSILSIRDITQRMREFQSASFLPFAPYNSAAIFYILLTLAAASLVSAVERKYEIRHR